MNKKIITVGIICTIVVTLGIAKGFSVNLISEKPSNKIGAASSDKENSDLTSSKVDNLALSSTVAKESNTVQKAEKNNDSTKKDLTKIEMNELLSKIQGDWYDLSNEAEIEKEGPRDQIIIDKENDSYYIARAFPDTALVKKIRGIKQLDANGKYSLTVCWDGTRDKIEDGPDEIQVINISNDFKTMFVTSEYDQNTKFIKATKESTQFVQLVYLSGKYKDNKNREYILNKDGIATWPNNTFKFSVDFTEELIPGSTPYIEVTYYLLAMDQKGKETMRYIYERIGNKLCIYKTVVDSKNNYRKGDLAFNLTKLDGVRDLNQKAIDMVAEKYNAIAYHRGESGVVTYKSDLGKISFDCSFEKDKYIVSIFGSSDDNVIKKFSVDILTGSIEECK